MRFSTLVILAFLVGCSGAPTTQTSATEGWTTPAPGSPSGDPSGDNSGGPCDNAFETLVIDGGTVLVPIPCNTGWIDPSDPPPDIIKQRIVDPAPEQPEQAQGTR